SKSKPENIITPAILKRMLIAGGKLLEINKQIVDSLNVFPVPDGDTGTNMSLTMKSAVKEVYSAANNNMEELSKKLASGALKGARGNSGVILSQIFKGFAAGIQNKNEIDAKLFAKSLMSGVQIAYAAVAKPREGTILTVARVMAEQGIEISKKPISMADFLNKLVSIGEDILSKTPDMLDVLKKAGVVDSGGYGLVVIFKGFVCGYNDIEITGAEDYNPANSVSMQQTSDSYEAYIDYELLDDIEFAYCTEFFIINLFKKTMLADIDKLREKLITLGDSVVVVGDLSMIKVHVHTNNPGLALQYALDLGELEKLKIENMKEQNRQLKARYEAEKKPIGMLAICSGEGFKAIFKDLLVDQIIEGGQTMNPSADDIAQAINKINAENVIVLPNNKNIILAAEQARGLITNKQVFVVPTKNIPQGLAATLVFNPESSVQENLNYMNNSIPSVRAGSVTFAVRSSAIDGLELNEGDIIGLDGNKIVNKGETVSMVTKDLIEKIADENNEILTLYYGKDVPEADAEVFASDIRKEHPNWEVDTHFGGQPLYYYIFSLE
ncbi:MAG: DAK2 domain-containing protein, partial [Clostridia bacterium]